MLNQESLGEICTSRAVGSPVPNSGRYQHQACTKTQIFNKGDILVLCTNPDCPNRGANWTPCKRKTHLLSSSPKHGTAAL
jgi:hypothetical protein